MEVTPEERLAMPGGELSDEDVVPGFRCPVASVFPAARPVTDRETVPGPARS